ncbi:KorA family transcriptional regulator [Bartonella tribocorum]|uniref:KorA protein n=2 Tax=Bartonella tribocorum TaxID=85701 RepID=Q7X272_9HYPH|nr:KorA family transcriptional regulator [Bartonella tribocorum]CAD42835.1 KorA protein [Bartonella tribocorum]CAK02472.1 KorA protein [Bartonella tribocorum CIP 105476]CDO49815.1 KorA protein [Bartonella tribocorum]
MKMIEQNSVDIAFSQRAAREITIVMRSEREWYFTFVADDPVTGKPDKYTLLTQRGKLRTWADPKYLFKFLRERGVICGVFNLRQDEKYEKIKYPSNNSS